MSFSPGLLDMLPVLHSKDISAIHDADFDWGEEVELAFPVRKIYDYLWSPSISLSWQHGGLSTSKKKRKWSEMNEHEWTGMNMKHGVQVVARKFVNLQPLPFSSSDLPQSKRRAFGWNWLETREKRGPKNLQKRKAVKQTSLDGSNEAFSLLHG